MESTFVEHSLPNGLRVVCELMPRVRSVSLGFLVRTGARHEALAEHGVSHFLEHMCFKGTASRDWRAVNVRFDELGSMYNAFTGKEHTVYYGWVPSAAAEPQLELLADMMRPALRPADFETERQVILEEIAMNADSFDHHVWNFLHETVFHGHALAHEILGERETIAALTRDAMVDYHRRRYTPGNVILLASGAVEAEALIAAAERYCGGWESHDNGSVAAPPPASPVGVRVRRLEAFKQQAVVLLYPSVRAGDARAESIEELASILGGANSRCYWNIVQKGICAQAGAAWLSYDDCGAFVLFADGQPERCEEMLAALREQARLITEEGVREDELQRVKNQRRTQLALEAENPHTRFMQMVDDVETFGHVRTAAAHLAAVQAVTRESIAEYLAQYPITGEGLLLSCGPRDWPTDPASES
jgi:predicted Zn-dependent peptidase